jgi:two-component system response regulator MprA
MTRVLIVEDDHDLAEMLANVLRIRYEVETAGDGAAGLAALEREHFDVVVVDILMPVLDGAAMLREMHARNITVPSIIASGTPELVEAEIRGRAAAVLRKPYGAEALLARIEAATRVDA